MVEPWKCSYARFEYLKIKFSLQAKLGFQACYVLYIQIPIENKLYYEYILMIYKYINIFIFRPFSEFADIGSNGKK